MIDLHPSFSGIPLAGVLLLVASEVLRLIPSLRLARAVVQTTAVVLCVVSVAAAFLSGYQASSRAGELSGVVEEAMARHHSLGRVLLINAVLLATCFFLARIAIHGRRVLQTLYYVAFVIQITLTVWVGYLGGQLVFTHAVNVTKDKLLE